METHINNIVSIFEYFSTEINDDKTNFRNADVWNNINTALRRIYRIELLIGIESKLDQKKPQQFPLVKKGGSYSQIYSTQYKANDVLKIEFSMFYPNIICRLHEEEILDLDIKYESFYYLIKKYKLIRGLLSTDGKMCLKMYVNYFYGKKLTKDERELVTGRGYSIMEHFTKYDGWIYADTDIFFIKDSIGLDEKLKNELSILELPYELEYIREMLVIEPKRYVEIDINGIGKIHGRYAGSKERKNK